MVRHLHAGGIGELPRGDDGLRNWRPSKPSRHEWCRPSSAARTRAASGGLRPGWTASALPVSRQLDAPARAELAVDAGQVGFDCLDADVPCAALVFHTPLI